MNTFNIPSVDHLIEGVHYRLVDWSFAEGQERDRGLQTNMPSRGMVSSFADGQECPEGEKMIFGMCRKAKATPGNDKDFDSSKKTTQEEEGEAQAKKAGSEFKNNKMIKDVKTGKKLGWAMKDGKPVLVEWGSVAGEKKVGPKKPATGGAAAATPKPKEKDKEKPKPQQPASSAPNNADNLVQEEKKRDLLPG
jgi:hypothetical protein